MAGAETLLALPTKLPALQKFILMHSTLDWPTATASCIPLSSTTLQQLRVNSCNVPEGLWRRVVVALPGAKLPGQFRALELNEGANSIEEVGLFAFPGHPFELVELAHSCPHLRKNSPFDGRPTTMCRARSSHLRRFQL